MNKPEIIKAEPICGGSPRIKETRVRVVDVILAMVRDGCSKEEITEMFGISEKGVESAIDYFIKHPIEIGEEIKEYREESKKEDD